MNCIKFPTLNYNLTLSLLPTFATFFTPLFSYTVVSFIIFVLSSLPFILLHSTWCFVTFLSLFKTFLCLLSILTPIPLFSTGSDLSLSQEQQQKMPISEKPDHNPVITMRRKFLYQKIMIFKVRALL